MRLRRWAAIVASATFLVNSAAAQQAYSGRSHQLDVRIPRLEAVPAIDGQLDEPVWQQAARLTGFSQYSPTDGIPAADSTDVLVWYSPTAIYFGIKAYEAHGAVHGTLANRDNIFSDDNIQIYLSTFHDGRQATVFAVNPLGVQADGVLVESGRSTGNSVFGNPVTGGREPIDLSSDYVFQSKGRLTPWGYEVEVRIPFKSLRYQSTRSQDWGLNVERDVQHDGTTQTWTPARRAAASFLGQSGTLAGITDIHRGLVMDLNPEVTGRRDWAVDPGTGAYGYRNEGPDIGGNVRWGVSNNLTLNGTANPD
ncbi:MAG: carbohydrate binding family 9 domain-containing protein, partial [Gemmatimonadales bacterium]